MRFLLGLVVGTALALVIAFIAAKAAFGDLRGAVRRDAARDVSHDVAKTVAADNFDAIAADGVYVVDVSVGAPEFSVSLSGAAEDLAVTEVRVEDGTLILGRTKLQPRRQASLRQHGLTAKIAVPALHAFRGEGVVDAKISGVDADALSLALSGVGHITAVGKCGHLAAAVSGVGDLDASQLKCAEADVTVSGVGNAKAYASDGASATVGGVGSITLYGEPKEVMKTKSFLGSITVK